MRLILIILLLSFFFICFENVPLGIPSLHTYIPLMCVGHEKQNELTLFSYIDN